MDKRIPSKNTQNETIIHMSCYLLLTFCLASGVSIIVHVHEN